MNTRVVGNAALAASRVVSTGPTKLLGIYGQNTSANAQYIQVHAAAALPNDGVVPVLSFVVPGNSPYSFETMHGFDLDAVTVCNSSTAATKTLGSADCSFIAILGN